MSDRPGAGGAGRGRFGSAVAAYARHRPGYPEALVAHLAAAAGVAGRRAVDVGCGTGQLTVPLARHAGSVLAVDPVPGMLEHGARAAAAAGVAPSVTWARGTAADLPRLLAPGARLACFAASFHWTDRVAVLADLDASLAPGGAVAVVDDAATDDDRPDWERAVDEVRTGFPGTEPAPGANGPMPVDHVDVLRASAFGRVTTSTWSWTRTLDVDAVVGLQLTSSFSGPEVLGAGTGPFCAAVRRAVLPWHPDGRVVQPLRVALHVATRA